MLAPVELRTLCQIQLAGHLQQTSAPAQRVKHFNYKDQTADGLPCSLTFGRWSFGVGAGAGVGDEGTAVRLQPVAFAQGVRTSELVMA